MKVLLIAPHFSGHREQVAFLEPTGICFLAAMLERQGHEARVIHQVTPEYMTHEAIVRAATDYGPDVIGISTMTENYNVGLGLSRMLKQRLGAPIVFGGVHATYNPEIVLEPSIDMAIVGSGFKSLPELLRRMESGEVLDSVPGLARRADGEVALNPNEPGPGVSDIDSLPMAKRDGLPIERYKVYPMLLLPPSRQRILSVYTSWGCRYNCDFCLVPDMYGHVVLRQSPDRVLEEIEYLKSRFNVNFVHFHDDDFCDDVGRVEMICQGMIDRKIDLKFGMMTRFDHLTGPLLDLMEEAGLIMLTLGIEAGTQEGLKSIHKGLTLDSIRGRLDLTLNRRMQVNGTYMIGFPWETRQSALEAFRFILSLPLDTWSLNIFIPFKGLRIRETMEAEGLIKCNDLSRYSYKQAVVATRELTSRDLEVLSGRMLLRYYFRWSYIRRLLRRMVRHPVMLRSSIEVLIWGLSRRYRVLLNSLKPGRRARRDAA